MPLYKFLIRNKNNDPRNGGYMQGARALGFQHLQSLKVQDLYFIEGQLSQEELQPLALKLLTDPVVQTATWDDVYASSPKPKPDSVILEVSLRPGVTDPVSTEIVRAAHELGLAGVHRAATGSRFEIEGLSLHEIDVLANQLLANNVIQHWKLGNIEPSFPEEVESSGAVQTISIRHLTCD